jgi:D-threo-aldose 1-dehydrogenase
VSTTSAWSAQVLRHADLDAVMWQDGTACSIRVALPSLLPECARRGVRVALGGVFNSGILAGGVRSDRVASFDYAPASSAWIARTAAIEAVCDEFGVPLRAAALQFPLAHPAVSIVIVGAHNAATVV